MAQTGAANGVLHEGLSTPRTPRASTPPPASALPVPQPVPHACPLPASHSGKEGEGAPGQLCHPTAGRAGRDPTADGAGCQPCRAGAGQGRASGSIAWRVTHSAGSTRAAGPAAPAARTGRRRGGQAAAPSPSPSRQICCLPSLFSAPPFPPRSHPRLGGAGHPHTAVPPSACLVLLLAIGPALPAAPSAWLPYKGGQQGPAPLVPVQRSSPGPARDARTRGHGLARCGPGTSSHLPSLAASLAWHRGKTRGDGGQAGCRQSPGTTAPEELQGWWPWRRAAESQGHSSVQPWKRPRAGQGSAHASKPRRAAPQAAKGPWCHDHSACLQSCGWTCLNQLQEQRHSQDSVLCRTRSLQTPGAGRAALSQHRHHAAVGDEWPQLWAQGEARMGWTCCPGQGARLG